MQLKDLDQNSIFWYKSEIPQYKKSERQANTQLGWCFSPATFNHQPDDGAEEGDSARPCPGLGSPSTIPGGKRETQL